MTTKLEQAARQALEFIDYFVFNGNNAAKAKSISTALREALAEQADINLNCKSVQKRLATSWGYVKAEQAEQEPVGRWNWNEAKFEWLTKFDYYKHHMTPLYAAPVRTKDLTDDEIQAVTDSVYGETDVDEVNYWRLEAARAVIAADREKNRG